MTRLSIFNLNCWLFPSLLSSDCNSRVIDIIGMIKERDPDIITLQEVWSYKYLSYFAQNLPDYSMISSQSLFYNKTGLVTLIKRSKRLFSSEINFFKFSLRQNFTEWFSRKGYITTEFESDGQKFLLINTHLYAPFSEPAKAITEEQLKKLIHSASGDNAILCGDFNLDENMIAQINRGRFTRLCNSEPTLEMKNPYCRKRLNRFISIEDEKIDYMLLRGKSFRESSYEIIKESFVSDHYPMFVQISFSE